MTDERPAVVVIPRAHFRAALCAGLLLSIGAVTSSVVAAINAADSHAGFEALTEELGDQHDQNADLQQQLDCRYILGADVTRLQSDIFVTTAQALAAARRRDTAAVDLLAEHLDRLAVDLEQAQSLREDAVRVCQTEPENVLG
jgi:hypothetical protein